MKKEIEQYYIELSEEHRPIVKELRKLFLTHDGIIEQIRRGCLNFTFSNGMRCYINCRNKRHPILGVSRGAWMVKQRPVLGALFDEVKTVVGKIVLKSTETIEQKGISALLEKISELPEGIGVK